MKLPWLADKQPVRPGYADFEPLISDRRVHAIASIITDLARGRGLTDDTDFVTFIQPATTVQRNGLLTPIPEVGVFAVISDDPRHPGLRVMTQASVWLKDWRATDAARLHFVSGNEDPALPIFKQITRDHLEKLKNLREMI